MTIMFVCVCIWPASMLVSVWLFQCGCFSVFMSVSVPVSICVIVSISVSVCVSVCVFLFIYRLDILLPTICH